MGDRRGYSCWVAAIAIFICGSSIAAETAVRGGAKSHTMVMPADYRLPGLVAAPRPPAQPIPFSHAHHAGTLGLGCPVCHAGVGPIADKDGRSMNGAHMTLPATQICMNCHVAIAADRPNIQRLAKYHVAGEEVPWVRIYRVLNGVKWTHKPHLNAGIKCQTCHGDVANMQVMSVATPVTAMASCLNCHRATWAKSRIEAKSQCETCHAWPVAGDFRRWSD